MAKNKLSDLRDHLFETIEALKDKDEPIEVERAKAISDVALTIIKSAKVEVEFFNLTGQKSKSFFIAPPDPERPQLPAARKPNGGAQAR